MTKRRHSAKAGSKAQAKTKKASVTPGKARVEPRRAGSKMKMHGFSIDIPPELGLAAGAPFDGRDRPVTMRIPKDIQELFVPLVEMATNAWRLKVRMVDSETGEPKEETRKLYRFVEGLFRALGDAGIQVIDKTGKPYDNGMSEKVISFEETASLARDEIIATVRPSIRWKEQPLHHGEIIVGIPVSKTPPEETRKTEAAATPAQATTELTQATCTAKASSAQSEELLRPEECESLDTPEPDAVASDKTPVAAQTDSDPKQPEPAITENPSEHEVQSERAEDESVRATPADTHEDPADPKTEHADTSERERRGE